MATWRAAAYLVLLACLSGSWLALAQLEKSATDACENVVPVTMPPAGSSVTLQGLRKHSLLLRWNGSMPFPGTSSPLIDVDTIIFGPVVADRKNITFSTCVPGAPNWNSTLFLIRRNYLDGMKMCGGNDTDRSSVGLVPVAILSDPENDRSPPCTPSQPGLSTLSWRTNDKLPYFVMVRESSFARGERGSMPASISMRVSVSEE
ncbi:hypothetical protein V8C86DRAFT_2456832 [Haematococcus lacustris]